MVLISFPPALPTSFIFIHLRASPDSRLLRHACIPLVIDLLLTFCPTRGEEKDRLCRTKDFWKHVRNLRPGCCQRLSFWACSPLAGRQFGWMPLSRSTALSSPLPPHFRRRHKPHNKTTPLFKSALLRAKKPQPYYQAP